MPAMRVTIAPGAAPVRLDRFARDALPGVPRRLLQRLFAEGAVRLNGRAGRKGDVVRPGDEVALPALPALGPNPALPCRVLHADGRLIVLDKGAGVPSVPLDPRERDTAANYLLACFPELRGVGDPLACGLAHRLDTGTSGLLMAARDAATHDALRGAFAAGRVRKRYLALVRGPVAARLELETPLAHVAGDPGRMRPARAGDRAWPARTVVTPLRRFREATLVCAVIRTGVTHQVRVHLAEAGHPVLGDVRYGEAHAALAPGHHALHAAELLLPPLAPDPARRFGSAPPEPFLRLLEDAARD